MAKGIYAAIKEAMTAEGRLPKDFEPPSSETAPNQIRWAAGAVDGVGIFHVGEQDNEIATDRIVELLQQKDTANILAIVNEHDVLEIIDEVLPALRDNSDNLDIPSLEQYAEDLAFSSDDAELVKLGIGILGLFDWSGNAKMQERLITLGLYDEFTLYVIVAAQQWDNANEVVFRIAKNVDGWGKIHAVELLRPETDAIRDWILRHGCENDVMDAYLGLECARKSGLIETLRKDELDADLFDSICVLMEALFDEGPVPGISEYEHAEEAVTLYLQHALTHAKTLKHLWHVFNVPADDENVNISEKAKRARAEILGRESWRSIVFATLVKPNNKDFYYAVKGGIRLGIDVSEQLFAAVMGDPIEHLMWIRSVYERPEHAKALTELLERTLPLSKMATGMNDYLFATEYSLEHTVNEEALIGLGEYPNLGEGLVLAGLNSPVVRERKQACATLAEWSKKLGQPIASVAPALHSELKNIAAVEIDGGAKELLTKLIEGIV